MKLLWGKVTKYVYSSIVLEYSSVLLVLLLQSRKYTFDLHKIYFAD